MFNFFGAVSPVPTIDAVDGRPVKSETGTDIRKRIDASRTCTAMCTVK